ncbi:hypothetical protein BDBG_03538 [Blastomyces gilchristii SLH14081]|uniref:Uncharacterized protein n=2 Tax=Blastomyces TaxID=229219 RepID=A0A179UIB2_BLAGS|nr:uncharacterized protein BDBG_03538 [Blastomyces gilchristii SLH14081]EGE79269.2 hypothetical protein BDDG_02208 [Blastomyces dermatitidis ATCC 18188]EQL35724.1 hypothetical protein BDFG_02658 [Blastomyces dermatitidis ATCC 26199]OAT07483.1 hypothetical protein BDBG_03538 [Blastomyces gilchristii SLH14081]
MARFDPTVWSSAPTPKPRQDDEPQTSRRAKKRPFRTTNHNATASHPNTGRIHPNTGPSYRRDGAFKLGPVGGCGLGLVFAVGASSSPGPIRPCRVKLFALELPCLGDVRCSSIVYDLLRLDPFQKAGFVTLDTFKVLNALRLLIRNHFSFEISGPV